MALLENLVQGFARAAGADQSAEAIQQQKNRRQNLSDLELEAQTSQILGDVQGLQDRRSKLDPNSATYQKDLQTIDQALHDARGVLTDLYHPQNNPGALSKLAGFIQSHLGKNKGKVSATPAQAKASLADRMAGIESVAYTPNAPVNKFSELRRQLKEAMPNATEEQLDNAVLVNAGAMGKPRDEQENWKPQQVVIDGHPVTLQYNTKDGRWTYIDGSEVPPEVLKKAGLAPKPGAAGKPKKGWFRDSQGYYSMNIDPATNQPMPGTEDRSELPPASIVGRITTGDFHYVDDQGMIHAVQETHKSTPNYGGGTKPPAATSKVPKTPAEAKAMVKPPATSGDRIYGHKDTQPQATARKAYNEAVGFKANVDAILQRQARGEPVAVEQKRTLVKLEKLAAGRFTTQAVDYIKQAGLANSFQEWVNKFDTGELPENVWQQVVNSVKDYVTETQAAMKSSGITPGADANTELLKRLQNMK